MRKYVLLAMVYLSGSVSAVNISTSGYGQVIILPYYTVNNSLNSLITISNSTDMTKALKVNVLDGTDGKHVLSFNLYLAPNDIWVAGLVPTTSTIGGHLGEFSASIVFSDSSCTPFLGSGQEFLPFALDSFHSPQEFNMLQSREGYIEVFEMGELDPVSELGAAAVANSNNERACNKIQDAFQSGGVWDDFSGGSSTTEVLPAMGGVSADLSIIDVAEGTLYSIDGVAFENFYPDDTVIHNQPGEILSPTLNDASKTSLIINKGEAIIDEWEHGYQAISALLMKNHITGYYDLDNNTAATTELLISMPTKHFYISADDQVEKPFTFYESEQTKACAEFDVNVFNRESNNKFCDDNPTSPECNNNGVPASVSLKLTPAGPPQPPKFCYATDSIQMVQREFTTGFSEILGQYKFIEIESFLSGKLEINTNTSVIAPSGYIYHGLPMLSYTLNKYNNATAAPGLLAQYGGVSPSFYRTKIDQQTTQSNEIK